jgi:hypothetical protein
VAAVLAKRLKIPYWTVDADVVVPSRVFDRSFVLLHHFRPHLKRELPKYLVAPQKISPIYMEATDVFTKLRSFARHNRGIHQTRSQRGACGHVYRAARMRQCKRLKQFVNWN